MRAMPPHIDVPGDNLVPLPLPNGGTVREQIMRRAGECLGMTSQLAVWRFGFTRGSEAADAYGVSLPEDFRGFVWVLATRKTGKVRETVTGFALELPEDFNRVIDN